MTNSPAPYTDQMAQDIAKIDQILKAKIRQHLSKDPEIQNALQGFLSSLQKKMYPALTEADVVDMISQALITKPAFELLFKPSLTAKSGSVSEPLQTLTDLLEKRGLKPEDESLDAFHRLLQSQAKNLDDKEMKRKVVVELFDEFLPKAFPQMVARHKKIVGA